MWWTPDKAMLNLHGQLPDVMGAEFEATIVKLAEHMKPASGEAWDSFEHRAADALLQLCDPVEGVDEHEPTLARRPVVQVHVPRSGPAEIAGVPIADSLLEQLRANASIEPVLVDEEQVVLPVGTRTPALSPKITRAVLLRDGQCRVFGCGRRKGLEAHHLVPRSRGGTDDVSNLAMVCPAHHRLLVPHGRWALLGNPNLPDGLRLVEAADLSPPNVT
jgi:HNH endonuclease